MAANESFPSPVFIDLERLYRDADSPGRATAKLASTEQYLKDARKQAGRGREVVLTGAAPVWLYLRVAHELHGLARKLHYESPVTGRLLIFDHDPL